jgi:hypothetical protein
VNEAAYLLGARAVRERAQAMLALAEAGQLSFTVDWSRLPAIAERVAATTRASYPDLDIPPHSRWRHFSAGGVDRLAKVVLTTEAAFDLVVASVLLDAGAGPRWRYREPGTGLVLARSEGLAVASLHMFLAGGFERVTEEALAHHFQVTPDNPLVGLRGRVELLHRLRQVLPAGPRALLDDISGTISGPELLGVVLRRLGPIWPGRESLDGVDLGDTWRHPRLGLVPLHKLSQWLTYSLLEPLQGAGVAVTDLEGLTGLAEYRNGGLFIDGGLLVPRIPLTTFTVDHPAVVEWRSLTVALLDRVAVEVRRLLGADLPLVKILEGGTWRAGREIAAELRSDGRPPLRVESDGTVF